jgi:hypothetical protein
MRPGFIITVMNAVEIAVAVGAFATALVGVLTTIFRALASRRSQLTIEFDTGRRVSLNSMTTAQAERVVDVFLHDEAALRDALLLSDDAATRDALHLRDGDVVPKSPPQDASPNADRHPAGDESDPT